MCDGRAPTYEISARCWFRRRGDRVSLARDCTRSWSPTASPAVRSRSRRPSGSIVGFGVKLPVRSIRHDVTDMGAIPLSGDGEEEEVVVVVEARPVPRGGFDVAVCSNVLVLFRDSAAVTRRGPSSRTSSPSLPSTVSLRRSKRFMSTLPGRASKYPTEHQI